MVLLPASDFPVQNWGDGVRVQVPLALLLGLFVLSFPCPVCDRELLLDGRYCHSRWEGRTIKVSTVLPQEPGLVKAP